MYLSIFAFDGYAFFVWPAFLFTFLCCTYLFVKIKKELKNQEQLFSRELEALQAIQTEKAAKTASVKKIYQLS